MHLFLYMPLNVQTKNNLAAQASSQFLFLAFLFGLASFFIFSKPNAIQKFSNTFFERSLADRQPAQDSAELRDILNLSNDTLDESPKSQALFYTHIEADAMRFYDVHIANLNRVDRGLWARMIRKIVTKMKELKLGLKAVARFGRPASRVFKVSFFVSNIVPFMLYPLGLNELATFILLVPWELVIPPLYMVGSGLLKVGSNFLKVGLLNYPTSIKLRYRLLGMSDRQRLTTILDEEIMSEIEADPNNRWVSISNSDPFNGNVSKIKKFLSINTLLGQSISISELENIVRIIPDGQEFIDAFHDERVDRELYALELWHTIRSDESARNTLKELLKQRLPNTHSVGLVKLARQLSISRDIEKALISKEEELLGLLAKAQKTSIPSAEQKALKSIAEAARNTSVRLFRTIHALETYALAAHVIHQESVYNFDQALEEAQKLYSVYHKATEDMKLFDQDRRITAQSIAKTLGLSDYSNQKKSFARNLSCKQALGLMLNSAR